MQETYGTKKSGCHIRNPMSKQLAVKLHMVLLERYTKRRDLM